MERTPRLRRWTLGFAVATLSETILVAMPSLVVAAPQSNGANLPSPTVSQCKLESTQRVAFRIDHAPQDVELGLQLRFYDAKKSWMADELTYNNGVDAPILPVAGLFVPREVASVSCSIEGYIHIPDLSFVRTAPASASGRIGCQEQNGLNVDGGPDADFEAAIVGKDWMMAQFLLSINHFFPNEESEFNGDVFSASLDRGPEQKIVVSGQDPQMVSYLFTGLQLGMHQIDYGPWAVYDAVRTGSPGYSRGYHNFCVRM